MNCYATLFLLRDGQTSHEQIHSLLFVIVKSVVGVIVTNLVVIIVTHLVFDIVTNISVVLVTSPVVVSAKSTAVVAVAAAAAAAAAGAIATTQTKLMSQRPSGECSEQRPDIYICIYIYMYKRRICLGSYKKRKYVGR